MRCALTLALLMLIVPAPAAAQERLAVEELRTLARSKVGSMKKDFQTDLRRAARILKAARPTTRNPLHLQRRDGLVPWATVFGKEIVETLAASDSKNLHHHLLEVLIAARAPETAELLVKLLGSKDADFDRRLLRCLGRIGNRAVAPAIRARLEGKPDAALLSASMSALARLGDEGSRPLAQRSLTHADPQVRISALQVLVGTSTAPRKDAATILGIAREDPEATVRQAAIGALGAFPGDPNVLRLLHDTVSGNDAGRVKAALAALERVASKEVSRPYLLKAVQSGLPLGLRETAARILLSLDDSRGALLLYKEEIAEARRDPKNRNLQRLVAQKLMGLGAWDSALDFLDRARDPKASARSQFTIFVEMARCHSRLGNYGEARKQMKRAGYKNLSAFADDPDFEAMRKVPEFAPLFEKGS